jgi:hypothetical protein
VSFFFILEHYGTPLPPPLCLRALPDLSLCFSILMILSVVVFMCFICLVALLHIDRHHWCFYIFSMPSEVGRVLVLLPRHGAAGRASVLPGETDASELLFAYIVASARLRVPFRAGWLACKRYGGMVSFLMSTGTGSYESGWIMDVSFFSKVCDVDCTKLMCH